MSHGTLRDPLRFYDDIYGDDIAEEETAPQGLRALDADEQIIYDRIRQALTALGGNATEVDVEVNRELVTLRGQVADGSTMRAIEEAVARVTGVETIHNQVVVAAR